MHPVLVRFLEPAAVHETLGRIDSGAPLSPEETAWAEALARLPEQKAHLPGALGRRPFPEAVQRAILLLAAEASIESLRKEPAFAPALEHAEKALRDHGATGEQVSTFLAMVVVEEAFSGDGDVDDFDEEAVLETLQTVPALAALDPETVERLSEGFVQGLPEARRDEGARVVSALVDAAWSEGPEPINPEHLETAKEALPSASEQALLAPLLQHLETAGLVGPKRLARLLEALREGGDPE